MTFKLIWFKFWNTPKVLLWIYFDHHHSCLVHWTFMQYLDAKKDLIFRKYSSSSFSHHREHEFIILLSDVSNGFPITITWFVSFVYAHVHCYPFWIVISNREFMNKNSNPKYYIFEIPKLSIFALHIIKSPHDLWKLYMII